MKTISLQKNEAVDNGKPNRVFAIGGSVHSGTNRHVVSGMGIHTTRDGVNAETLIPWSEIDAIVSSHEPLLKS